MSSKIKSESVDFCICDAGDCENAKVWGSNLCQRCKVLQEELDAVNIGIKLDEHRGRYFQRKLKNGMNMTVDQQEAVKEFNDARASSRTSAAMVYADEARIRERMDVGQKVGELANLFGG